MKYLYLVLVVTAYLILQHYITADYNAQVCSTYGKQPDCITRLERGSL